MNELTLECMMNPYLYDKYKCIQEPIYEKQREKDIEKYKHKIIHTTKLMFTQKSSNETLNSAFNQYIDECISVYKTKEMQKQPQPEHPPSHNDISFNYAYQEHNKTIKMDKFVKRKNNNQSFNKKILNNKKI
tara:strand:+ start:11337 stop:11732 length:396 start_codon:yes stop_codon:yes gene_type:complete